MGAILTATIDRWRADTGNPVKLSIIGSEQSLAPRVKYQLLQITREALANVAKHAASSHTWVDLEYRPNELTLSVRDDGRGFSPAGSRGHGMGIMRERSALIGASVEIKSTPGDGSEVVMVYPGANREDP